MSREFLITPTYVHLNKFLTHNQPLTIRDFMNYLIYIEHSAENLQFFLWYQDYLTRFQSATTSDLVLAPEWTTEQQEETFARLQKEHRDGLKRDPAAIAPIFRGTDFEKRWNMSPSAIAMEKPNPTFVDGNPFSTPPTTPTGTDSGTEYASATNASLYRSQAQDAFTAAGIKAPCKSNNHN